MSAAKITQDHRVALLGAILDRQVEAKHLRLAQAEAFCDGHDDRAAKFDVRIGNTERDRVLLDQIYDHFMDVYVEEAVSS